MANQELDKIVELGIRIGRLEQELLEARREASKYQELVRLQAKPDRAFAERIRTRAVYFNNQSDFLRSLNKVAHNIVSLKVVEDGELVEYSYS